MIAGSILQEEEVGVGWGDASAAEVDADDGTDGAAVPTAGRPGKEGVVLPMWPMRTHQLLMVPTLKERGLGFWLTHQATLGVQAVSQASALSVPSATGNRLRWNQSNRELLLLLMALTTPHADVGTVRR